VTNGRRMHAKGTDGRSAEARRFKDLVVSFAAPFGGEAALSEAERALVRNAAALTLRCEALQANVVAGRVVDNEEMTRLANSSARVLAALGRRSRLTPSLTASPLEAPDLTQLSNDQLDRLYALLVEANEQP
jgi:hypothetical protein